MCGRFHMLTDADEQEIIKIVEEIDRRYKDNPAREKMQTGEVFPTNIVPVIAYSKALEPTPFLMKWGFSGYGTSKAPIINARSETALEKPTFKKPLLERRCLIPAANYYEWETIGKQKTKYAIKTLDEIIYMAGMYRYEEGQDLPLFTILTRDAAPDIAHIHNRMPVIIPRGLISDWLSANANVTALIAKADSNVRFKVA